MQGHDLNLQRPGADTGETSLIDAMRIVLRYRMMVLVMLVSGLVTGWVYQKTVPPRYIAEALVMLEASDAAPFPGDGQAPATQLNGEIIQTEVRLLGSRSLIREVVLDNELGHDTLLRTPERGAMFKWVSEALALPALNALDGEFGTSRKPPSGNPDSVQVIDAILDNLEVVRDGKTHVIAIRYTSSDAEHAAVIANAIAKRYVVGRIQERFDYAHRADQWINQQLASLKERFDQSSSKLAARERALASPSIDSLMIHSDHLAAFNRELVNARVTRQDKENRLARVRVMLREGNIGGAIEDIGSSVILQNLHALKAQRLRREAELSAQLGPKHPTIIDMRQEREELSSRIETEQDQLVKRFENDVALARQRESAIADELDRLKGSNQQMAAAASELDTLRQQVALDQRVYEEFISRFKPIDRSEEIGAPDARVISEATAPSSPAWPKPSLIIAIAMAVSIGMALIATYVRELSETGIRNEEDLMRATGLTSLAMVLQHKTRRVSPHDAIIEKPNSAYSESVRTLLSGLFSQGSTTERGQVFVVASTLPGEGKSTTALSLARAAAMDGIKVLLVDGDIRRPTIHKLANVPLGPGIDVLLKGELQPKDVIIRDGESKLDILPGASLGERRNARLGRTAPMDRLFERLRHRYQLILVDSSPLIAVADAKAMMPHADGVLMLVRWRKTARALLRQSLEGIRASGGVIAGVAVTQVDGKRQRAYEPAERTFSRKAVEAYYTE